MNITRAHRRWPATMAVIGSAAVVLAALVMITVAVTSLGRDLAFAAPQQVYDLRTEQRIELSDT